MRKEGVNAVRNTYVLGANECLWTELMGDKPSMSGRRNKGFSHPPTVRGVFEEAECDAVAPKMKIYFCERCKEYVLPLGAHVTMELIVSIPSMKVTETEIATHIKCGSTLTERFWKE